MDLNSAFNTESILSADGESRDNVFVGPSSILSIYNRNLHPSVVLSFLLISVMGAYFGIQEFMLSSTTNSTSTYSISIVWEDYEVKPFISREPNMQEDEVIHTVISGKQQRIKHEAEGVIVEPHEDGAVGKKNSLIESYIVPPLPVKRPMLKESSNEINQKKQVNTKISSPNILDISGGEKKREGSFKTSSSNGGIENNKHATTQTSVLGDGEGVFHPPKLVRSLKPDYPSEARHRGEEGRVLLEVEIDSHGVVERVTIIQGSGYSTLDKAALLSVKRWEFSPATKNTRPVASKIRLPIVFEFE